MLLKHFRVFPLPDTSVYTPLLLRVLFDRYSESFPAHVHIACRIAYHACLCDLISFQSPHAVLAPHQLSPLHDQQSLNVTDRSVRYASPRHWNQLRGYHSASRVLI